MKKYLIFAASALALASCSSDDFVGDNSGNLHGTNNGEIAFAGGTAKITRAGNHVGADAAKLLNNQFIVAGFKSATAPTTGVSATPVFDHYTVKWEANTAGTTADNTSDWRYVGLNPQTGLATVKGPQTIKYWDYSTAQYDYIAFSTGAATIKTGTATATGDDEVLVTAVTPTTATSSTGGAYTIKGTVNALNKCYIADLVTAYNPEVTNKPKYQDEVTLSFRNLTTKVRVALYETIPGYSVKDVMFYSNGTDDNKAVSEKSATLFASGTEATDKFYGSGTATVYFPTVGKNKISNSDYNKAHVAIAGENPETFKAFGNLSYGLSDDERLGKTDADKLYLATKSSDATYATGKDHYEIVLPNEAGTTLTLRVNYTLVANDGSKEEIKVYGAKAIIPAIYAQWKSNYAYTYIFKISDKTNGMTGMTTGPEGLYPITFDAVVADSEEGNQSTITTVATPSITTYQKGHDITKDEYSKANGNIYVMAMDKDGKLISDLDKAKLYTVTTTGTTISEATVHDALTIGATSNGNTITGRNGIKLTNADMTTASTIPGIDGNNITVVANTATMFTPAANTYAFVYEITPTTAPASTELHTAVTVAAETDLTGKGYYKDEACTDPATGTTTTKKVYYQKVTNTNKTYAIKVIKVVD